MKAPWGRRRPKHLRRGRLSERLFPALGVALTVTLALSGGFFVNRAAQPAPVTIHTVSGGENAVPSAPLFGKVLPPAGTALYWGAFEPKAPRDLRHVLSLLRRVGRPPAVLMWFQKWYGQRDFPVEGARWLFRHGMVPMMTWEPWRPSHAVTRVDQPAYRLANIASGAFDAYIRKIAEQIRDYGGPLMLRPMHEMDGDWYPWGGTVNGNTPEDYVAAWRHMHKIFDQVGATNVTWVWSVNHRSVPANRKNSIHNYWPGGRFVDWVGISGFNRGAGDPYVHWRSFREVLAHRYETLLGYGKPVAVTETSSVEIGGDKAAWIKQAFATLFEKFPAIKMIVWFDHEDWLGQDWQIDSSPASLRAFRDAIADPRVVSGGGVRLRASSA